MLQPNGKRLLQIIGKGGARGIILPEQMPAAIAALEAAIAQEEAALKAAQAQATEKGEDLPRSDAVLLRQRAVPFIDMLRRCHAADKEIVWGV
jgi:hypothetical protein